MPEIPCRPLRRPEFDRFLAAAKRSPYFKEVEPSGRFIQEGASVPDLTRYHFRKYGSIALRYKTKDTREFVQEAFTLIEELTPLVNDTLVGIKIAESGIAFDPDEESDTNIMFGIDEFGPSIHISTGDISPGYNDLDYRLRLFNGCFGVLGLATDLEAVIIEGKLKLQVNPDRFILSPRGDRALAGYNPSSPNLVRLNMAQFDGSNFHEVILHTFASDQFRSGVETLVRHFGAEKLVAASLTVMCESEGFPAVRDRLNVSGLTPWETTCSMVSDLSIDLLDQAISQYESFSMRGFVLKVPKTGSIDAEISYSDGEFRLDFYTDAYKEKSIDKLKSLIIELAGTPDFFVPEEDLI